MRYWDASALIPLLLDESSTPRMTALLAEDDEIATWWGTRLECAGAIHRLEREGKRSDVEIRQAVERLREALPDWAIVDTSEDLARHAERLLRIHPLRSADAIQLAAAHMAVELLEEEVEFVTLDRRLAAIAEREGFTVVT